MSLTSLFSRRHDDDPRGTSPRGGQDAAGDAKLRARRRLIGALVLLGVGIVAFPLLFETEPRPIPVDLPIEIPRKESAAPLVVPPPTAAKTSRGVVADAPASADRSEPPPPAATDAPPPVAAAKTAAPVDKPSTEPRAAPEPTKPETARPAPANQPAAAAADRFVVQIGAFAESRTVRDVRERADRIGVRTYTQVVTVQAGERTRVRVGPFGSREEAEQAAGKLQKAGLPASVLKL